jgi:hypothetical protein
VTLDRASARALKAGDQLLAQVGLTTALARLTPLSERALAPGETGVIALRLAAPTPWFPGIPLILRGFERLPGAGLTLAGGQVLRAVDRPTPAARRPTVVTLLRAMGDGDPTKSLVELLGLAGAAGLSRHELAASLPAGLGGGGEALRAAIARGEVTADGDHLWLASARPAPAPAPEARPDPAERDAEDLAALVVLLRAQGLTPTWRDDLSEALAAHTGRAARNVEPLVARGVRSGALVRVAPDLVYAAEALAQLQEKVIAHLRAISVAGAPGELSVPDLKLLAGATRRWAVPLLGWLDRERVTVRTGDLRRLHPRHLSPRDAGG